MAADTSSLDRYVARGYRKVDGWLSGETVRQIVEIDRIQRELGIVGNVAEIGVHHGRLFILLYLLARADERALAIDIFENQALNRDRSGLGALSILQQNVVRHAGATDRLCILSADSTSLGGADVRAAAGGPFRLFSVDGGHLANIVRHDLNTAAAAICDGGLVILDDYFNPEYPGVSEGVNQFFHEDNAGRLAPFYVGMNKLYVTTAAYADTYMDRFARRDLMMPLKRATRFRVYTDSGVPIRVTEMFGATVLSYSPDRVPLGRRLSSRIARRRIQLRRRLSDSRAWRHLRGTWLGGRVRRLADRFWRY